jgi:hypothetical protein
MWTAQAKLTGPSFDEELAEQLADRLEQLSGIVAADAERGVVEATFAVPDAGVPGEMGAVLGELGAVLETAVEKLCADVGIADRQLVALRLVLDTELDAELEQPAYPELVGVAEIAELLGVTRQRASELRRRAGFPRPIAELRSGPVWPKSWITRFAGQWERRPGRPRTRSARA